MKGTKERNTNKGITLIALVITIIVMLILVAVTISMAVNGGLFNYAGKAVGETQNALDVEQQLANGAIQVNGVWYDSIDDYLNGKPALVTIHTWTRGTGEDIDKFTCSHCNTTYTMGQTVNYTATGTSTLYADRLGMTVEEGFNEMPVTSQDTTWVVLGIQDTNGDDVNETLLITSATPVELVAGGYSDFLEMTFEAAEKNGPEEINRICKELFSNSEYGEARGMTIEDVDSALNFTPLGGYTVNMYGVGGERRCLGNFTTKFKDLPDWTAFSDAAISSEQVEIVRKYEDCIVNYYIYCLDVTLGIYNPDDISLNQPITQVEKDLIFGGDESFKYFLASRGYTFSEYAGPICLPGFVVNGYATNMCAFTPAANSNYDTVNGGLRPVVSLTSKLPEIKYE